MRDRFTYNGKELQGTLNYLDYGARMYDPSIGRWGVVDPLTEKWHMISSYTYALNDPIKFIDPDGNDVITGISNTRVLSKNLYETRDATLKITLTVVNSASADLSRTMFNKNNGVIDATKIFGGNLTAKLNRKDVEINLNKVSIDYKVVDKIENARKGDNFMIIANDIPKLPNKDLNPVGLASIGGTSSAVEANTIADNTFNKTAYHELAHNLGLGDTYGEKGDGTKGLMGYANNGSTSLSDAQKTQIIIAQGGAAYGNGTFSKQQSYTTYTLKAAAQFLKDNKIK